MPDRTPGGAAETRRVAIEQYSDTGRLSARVRLHAFSTGARRWPDWLRDQLDLAPRARVLEVGCGMGLFWAGTAGRIAPEWDLTLSDFSHGMLTEARRALTAVPHAFRFVRCGAEALPFAARAFDAVLAFHMLYHVPDRARALGEIRRVLRPGGRLYAATNGARHLRELHELRRRLAPEIEERAERMSHAFSLENGGAQIAAVFGNVALRRHEDGLAVGEAEAVADYLASLPGNARDVLRGERRQALLRGLHEEMRRQGGAIRIGKEMGLFVAEARD